MIPEPTLRLLLSATLRAAPPAPWRVFAYGSLIWQDVLDRARAVPATLPGFGRHYCQWDEGNRGTPGAPGFTLGLLRGAGCGGCAFAVGNEAELWPAWKQEMGPGHYDAAWVRLDGGAPALTFLSDRTGRLFAGVRGEEEVAGRLAAAEGPNGTAREYLLRTADALRRIGRGDRALDRLEAQLEKAGTGPGLPA